MVGATPRGIRTPWSNTHFWREKGKRGPMHGSHKERKELNDK